MRIFRFELTSSPSIPFLRLSASASASTRVFFCLYQLPPGPGSFLFVRFHTTPFSLFSSQHLCSLDGLCVTRRVFSHKLVGLAIICLVNVLCS